MQIDVRHLINVHNLKPEFNRLPLVKDWHLKQTVINFKYRNKEYYDLHPNTQTKRILDLFLYYSNFRIKENQTIKDEVVTGILQYLDLIDELKRSA
jgi:hypothetical protein